jgi:hypothetical protein
MAVFHCRIRAWRRKHRMTELTPYKTKLEFPNYSNYVERAMLEKAHEHYQAQVNIELLHKMAKDVGKAVVPLCPTGDMNRVIESDGWDWADLLAAAEAIDEQTYDALQDANGPSIAQMEAGAQALRDCGLDGTRESLMATADSVYRAMQEVRGDPQEQHRDLQEQFAMVMQACADAMPAGHWAQHAAAEHPSGNPMPVAVAAMTERIAGLEADLAERDTRIASMRTEHGKEAAELTERARHAEDVVDAAREGIDKLEMVLKIAKPAR